jgi:glycosyltransferase involved in cell wall biosynthesis
MRPVLTVAIPVFNGEAHIGAAIDSILRQTMGDFELLVADDGSTDATPKILQRYAAADPRVRIISREHRGIPATRNELLHAARADIVAWLDADDTALPDRLQRQFSMLSADPDLTVLGCGIAIVHNAGPARPRRVVHGARHVARRLEHGCVVAQTSCMMRRRPVIALGGYRAAYAYAQDYDLFLRVSERGKIDNADFLGVHYNCHGANVSERKRLQQNILFEMARATHKLRLAGFGDPTDAMTAEPACYFSDPVVKQLLGHRLVMHRAIARALAGIGDPDRLLHMLTWEGIDRKQRNDCQQAIVNLIRRRDFDLAGLAALARAGNMGPGRLVRRLVSH